MGRQNRRRQLSRGEKMTKIRACISPANGARAIWIGRPLVCRITRILNKHTAFARIEASMPRRSSRQHAIHHVDTERDVIGNLLRLSNAHQVTWPFARQKRGHFARSFRKSMRAVPRPPIRPRRTPENPAPSTASRSRTADRRMSLPAQSRIAIAPIHHSGWLVRENIFAPVQPMRLCARPPIPLCLAAQASRCIRPKPWQCPNQAPVESPQPSPA